MACVASQRCLIHEIANNFVCIDAVVKNGIWWSSTFHKVTCSAANTAEPLDRGASSARIKPKTQKQSVLATFRKYDPAYTQLYPVYFYIVKPYSSINI